MKQDFLAKFRSRKAALRYGHPSRSIQVILVAGLYGKTTTARLIAEVLRESGKRVALFADGGSYIEKVPYMPPYDNGADDLQQALSAAKKQLCEVAIVEYTTKLARHATMDDLAIEMIVATTEQGLGDILPSVTPNYLVVPSGYTAEGSGIAAHQMVSFGADELAEVRLASTKLYRHGLEIDLVFDHHTSHEVASYLVGRANALNVAAAIAAVYVLGVDTSVFAEGIARIERISGNYDYLELDAPYSVVVDRAVQPESVGLVLDAAKELSRRRLIVVCDESLSHDGAIDSIKSHADRIIVLGQGADTAGVEYVGSEADAVAVAIRGARQGDTVLLLGDSYAREKDGVLHAQTLIEATK
jgi:UDP-N-acetylmuramoyl-L-alanyl-D-glutamate--2,6-diaminopimelate ligase